MIVVKLGGSLYSNLLLEEWVKKLACIDNHTIVIVPGGGPFANQVRQAYRDWSIKEEVAHEMALLAMQQYAYLICHLDRPITKLETIDYLKNDKRTYVWLPHHDVVGKCDQPKNWQTTSDSIALWLAGRLSAQQLILIKSANIDGMSIDEIVNSDIVDNNFSRQYEVYNGDIRFYHSSQLNDFLHNLNHG